MGEAVKIRYEIDLKRTKFDVYKEPGHVLSRRDLPRLAQLMLDAYAGTIDSEGETLRDAVDEVSAYFDRSPLLKHSFQVKSGQVPLSAIFVSEYDGVPFISYVITDPNHKGRGLATEVASRALGSLQKAGYERVVFFVTDGNRASERLFKGLGAIAMEASGTG